MKNKTVDFNLLIIHTEIEIKLRDRDRERKKPSQFFLNTLTKFLPFLRLLQNININIKILLHLNKLDLNQ